MQKNSISFTLLVLPEKRVPIPPSHSFHGDTGVIDNLDDTVPFAALLLT